VYVLRCQGRHLVGVICQYVIVIELHKHTHYLVSMTYTHTHTHTHIHRGENDLDVHYWKDCPLLISCPSCAQIVEIGNTYILIHTNIYILIHTNTYILIHIYEIAGLPEHLLDECDSKDSYVPCEVTGLAIRSNEFAAWQEGPSCSPAPANCMYCPLCLGTAPPAFEVLTHMLYAICYTTVF
jgi:hypothetical protein